MTESFSLSVRYVCESCGAKSPSLRVRPIEGCTEARLPVFHPRTRDFEMMTIKMTLKEAVDHQTALETKLADRQWEIEKQMDVIATKRIKLLQAIKDGFGHPKLKDGVHTLNKQLESCEYDKLRHARLLSGDLGDLVSYVSRMRENGITRHDNGLQKDSVLLWPAPWTTGKKIQVLPCIECDQTMHEVVSGI